MVSFSFKKIFLMQDGDETEDKQIQNDTSLSLWL